jgi:DNA-dependent RNA polymerase auxiliary subunit epsilon
MHICVDCSADLGSQFVHRQVRRHLKGNLALVDVEVVDNLDGDHLHWEKGVDAWFLVYSLFL